MRKTRKGKISSQVTYRGKPQPHSRAIRLEKLGARRKGKLHMRAADYQLPLIEKMDIIN